VQPPSNYDDAGLMINVNPDTIYHYAIVNLKNAATVVAGAINAIDGIWQNLQLGWAGETATEAQDFSNKWNTAIQLLFGTEADPQSGAFEQLATAVATAASNYAQAEYSNWQMFESLVNSLNAPPGTPPPPTRNENNPPVTETAPAPP